MFLVQCIAITFVIISLLAAMHLGKAWLQLRTHPRVEPVEIAKPAIADELNNLIAEVSSIANVSPPPLFIRRARLPNAFVVAAIFRPELYITDELLEDCDGFENALERLALTICHEIAHIQRGDALKLGLLTYAAQLSAKLTLQGLEKIFQSTMKRIEQEADRQAEVIFRQLSRQN